MSTPVFTRVLVGWDGSAGAVRGLRLGCRLTALPGGRVTALSVVPGFSHVEDLADQEQAAEAVRAPLLATYREVISNSELHSEQDSSIEFIEEADVAGALDRYVATHRIDLVIVGLHGREGLLHPKMGHIASRSARIVRCPVLVVPEPRAPGSDFLGEEKPRARGSVLFHPFHHRP